MAGYGLTFSTLLITAGRLGDQIGRRRVFAIGLALFVLTSAACGLAPNPDVLVAARVLQGVAAALISPTVLSIIGVTFSGPDRVRAISIYGVVMGLAAAGGQLIGGVLIEANPGGLGWRSVFLINVPVGAGGPGVHLAVPSRVARRSRRPAARPGRNGHSDRRPDGRGAAPHPGPPARVAALDLDEPGGCPAAAGRVRPAPAPTGPAGRGPLVDLRLFRDRTFSAGLMTQLGLWCGQASFFLVLALYLQQGRGLDALQAGLVFTILAGAYLVASMRAPALTLRRGRTLIGVGALTLAAGHLLLVLAVADIGVKGSIAALVPGLVLVGAGMGLCITPLTSTVLASAGPRNAGAVSGALSTMQQVGNSIGVAVTGIIFFGAVRSGLRPRLRPERDRIGSAARRRRRPQPAPARAAAGRAGSHTGAGAGPGRRRRCPAAPPVCSSPPPERNTRVHDRPAQYRRLLADDPSQRQGVAPLPRRRLARAGGDRPLERLPALRRRPGPGRPGDPAVSGPRACRSTR